MSQDLVNRMETVWRSIADLSADFTQQQWSTPTECPGWSVQDQVSHLVGSECRLLGGRLRSTSQPIRPTSATT